MNPIEIDSYIDLLEDDTLYPTLLSNLIMDIDASIDSLSFAITNPRYKSYRPILIRLYNDLHKACSRQKIINYSHTEYVSIQDFLLELSAYLFDLDYFEIPSVLLHLIEPIENKLKRSISWRMSPEMILKEMNSIFLTKFILISEEKLSLNNIETISKSNLLNQYTLSVLYLMIAERLGLPIFGLPLSDTIVLCYTKDHCHHNEMVYEDDILFYFSPGPFGVIYSLEDLEFYALSMNVKLGMMDKLPKSNVSIIKQWIKNVKNASIDSSKFPSIQEKYFELEQMFKMS